MTFGMTMKVSMKKRGGKLKNYGTTLLKERDLKFHEFEKW